MDGTKKFMPLSSVKSLRRVICVSGRILHASRTDNVRSSLKADLHFPCPSKMALLILISACQLRGYLIVNLRNAAGRGGIG